MSDLDLLFSQALADSFNLYEEKERVAIVGSRKYPDLEKVRAYVMALPANVIIVSGGSEGVDTMAEETARARGLDVEIFLPDWQKRGKAAGPLRNQQIIDAADRVVAFWDGQSRGTKNSIELARKRGLPVEINPEIVAPFDRKRMIHFEQSRAGGTFSCHNVSTWSPGRVDIFKRWKDDPTGNPGLVEEMAQEIAARLRPLFGGTPPPHARHQAATRQNARVGYPCRRGAGRGGSAHAFRVVSGLRGPQRTRFDRASGAQPHQQPARYLHLQAHARTLTRQADTRDRRCFHHRQNLRADAHGPAWPAAPALRVCDLALTKG